MQIIFQTHFPKNIRGSFVYDIFPKSNKDDCFSELFIKLAENLSESLSTEPYKIETYPQVTFSNFIFDYRSIKKVKIIFKKFDNDSEDSNIFEIMIFFDTADNLLINEKINDEHVFYLKEEPYQLLDHIKTMEELNDAL